jgi:hypothetical protein
LQIYISSGLLDSFLDELSRRYFIKKNALSLVEKKISMNLTFIIQFRQNKKTFLYFSFSGHVPPIIRIKDNGNTEHIQRLKSLGLAEEDIQVIKRNKLKIKIFVLFCFSV